MTGFRIGVAPAAVPSGGGIHQYSAVMMSVLADLRAQRSDEFVVFGNGITPASPVLAGAQWEIEPLTPGRHALQRAQMRFAPGLRDTIVDIVERMRRPAVPPDPDRPATRDNVRDWLRACGIDLMVYPAPMPISFEACVPYVMAVHDLQHRISPQFPEVSAGDEYAVREYLFRNGVRFAKVIVTDSDTGKEDVLTYYGDLIDPDRVAVLPFLPATPAGVSDEDRQRVRRVYNLPPRYLFYPAQFWPHKNHTRIVEAIAMLEDLDVHLVLVGSSAGALRGKTYAEMAAAAEAGSVQDAIQHLGYVPNADMAALYANAVALVMPTFFGPTNIPILEAWGLGCPVITSDIRGVRDQAGDAALLVDPESCESIAAAIETVWTDETARAGLISRGRERLATYTRADYADRLGKILDIATS